MIISNAALNALLIYLAKHGPLAIPQEDVIAFSDKFVGLKLVHDKASGNFLVSANIIAPEAAMDDEHEAVMALGDAAHIPFVPEAVRNEVEQVKKSLPNNEIFGPSTLFGGPLQRRPPGPMGPDGFFDTTKKLDRVLEDANKTVHVQMVTLNGGPSDGQAVPLKLPLKRIVFLADKPSRTDEINDFVKAHAYMRREDEPRRQGGTCNPAYDYVGFKSREEIKEEYQDKFMDGDDDDNWWRG